MPCNRPKFDSPKIKTPEWISVKLAELIACAPNPNMVMIVLLRTFGAYVKYTIFFNFLDLLAFTVHCWGQTSLIIMLCGLNDVDLCKDVLSVARAGQITGSRVI